MKRTALTKYLLALVILPFICACNNNKQTYSFEAENADLYNCQSEETEEFTKEGYGPVSQNKAVGHIQKGSVVTFGINSSDNIDNLSFTLSLSCPLAWNDTYSGPCPTSFSLTDIYYIQVNKKEVSIKDSPILNPPEVSLSQTYNYYAMVKADFSCSLVKGDNTISFTCIAASSSQGTSYSSIGNIDCLSCSSSSALTEYKPVIDHEETSDFTFTANKTSYDVEEEVLVTVIPRENHPKDWVGLFGVNDKVTDGAIFSFYPAEEKESTVNIIGKNPSDSNQTALSAGYYEICYLADDSFEIKKKIEIQIVNSAYDKLMTLNKDSYKVGEDILVTAMQEEGHTSDWIGLFRLYDTIGQIGSLYYFYPSQESATINIIGQNPNQTRPDMTLDAGNYKVCYLKDDGYEILIEKHITLS